MSEINIYCDESNHLEKATQSFMVLGSVFCPKEKVREINKRLKEIKVKHKLAVKFETKWTKISPAKVQYYIDLIDYFFDFEDLHFRGVVIDKRTLNHKKFKQTHDDFYYKMYFELLSKILKPEEKYNIFLDIKDTRGASKIRKLHDTLCNSLYDFEKNIIKKVQQVRSYEIEVIQLTDLLIGALQFVHTGSGNSIAKASIINRIKERSRYSLSQSTLVLEPKFNIFLWKGEGKV